MAELSAAVEEVSEQAPPSEARPALKVLRQVLSGVVDRPQEAARWSADALQGRQMVAFRHIKRCLLAAGFCEADGVFQLAPGAADVASMRDCVDLVTCLLETMEVPPSDAAAASMEVDEDMDPELAEALRMSVAGGATGSSPSGPDAKRARQEDDAAVAARMAEEDEQEVDVEFERFNDENVLITNEAVKEINEFCSAAGEGYVDPQFPPISRSLYINESDAATWECFVCHARTELPPVPPMPTSKEEAEALETEFGKVACKGCGNKAPYVVKTRYFNRPCQWLRPGVKCTNCEATASIEYPGISDPKSLLELMCTHYLRSKATHKTLGQPWKIIRDQPRPEDVQQGALGNCWFAAALSIVASKPELIWSLFITREFNPHGAYQLQLFHAGDWRGILIDDYFPTSQVCPGKVVGNMVHYSRGGSLSYMSCARHQLWVPMVEKAAAKLAGSYGNLSSGTFGEALAMFSGFPTERLILYVSSEQRRARAELRDKKVAQRTEMLLRGETPPEEDEEDLALDDSFRDDMLWSKLLSFREAGYLMGMGCTEQGCEKTKEKILEMGLQAPHAYGILDVREITDATGKLHRLMQIRNPWGEDAPRTWTGAWGRSWDGWTFDLKLKLGVINRSNVTMYDQMSIFWMSFEDVKEYFAVVDVCRVHDGWEEHRERAWLPSGVGPGESFDVTIYERTQVDIVLWQEKHSKRESALGASTNVDVGFVVLRKKGDNEDGTPEFECIEHVPRSTDDCISKEMILEGGYVYRIAPLCFNQMQAMAPRRVTMVVHSSNPVSIGKVPSTWRDIACASLAAATKGKSSALMPGVRTRMLQERVGYIFAIENESDNPFGIQVDSSDSIGFVSSREGGACGCIDLVPPRSRKLVMAVAVRKGAQRTQLSFAFEGLPPEAAAWAVGAEDVHMALPLTPLASQQTSAQADPAILSATPPPRRRRPLAARGGQQTPKAAGQEQAEAEAALAEALRLSMQDSGDQASPTGDDGDEDDELAAAIRLSMAQGAAASGGAPPPAPASAPAPQAPTNGDAKPLVTQLFEEYRKQGLQPNEAAAKADAEAKARADNGAAPVAGEDKARQDLQQLVKRLFEEYRETGMAPHEAAAKAMQEAKRRASGN